MSFLGLILCVWPKIIQLAFCLSAMASLDASLDYEKESILETLDGYVEECWEVAEGSKPAMERSSTVEWSLEGHPDKHSSGEEKGEIQLQMDSLEVPLEVHGGESM